MRETSSRLSPRAGRAVLYLLIAALYLARPLFDASPATGLLAAAIVGALALLLLARLSGSQDVAVAWLRVSGMYLSLLSLATVAVVIIARPQPVESIPLLRVALGLAGGSSALWMAQYAMTHTRNERSLGGQRTVSGAR